MSQQNDGPLELHPTYIEAYPDPAPRAFNDFNIPGMTTGPLISRDIITAESLIFQEKEATERKIHEDYEPIFRNLESAVAHEAEVAKRATNPGNSLRFSQAAAAEHKAIISLIDSKYSAYSSLVPQAHLAVGHMLFFLTTVMADYKEKQFKKSYGSDLRDLVHWMSPTGALGISYRAAHELKRLSESIRLLSQSLNELALRREAAEHNDRGDTTTWLRTLTERFQTLESERAIHFQQLPHSLQLQFQTRAGYLGNFTLPQKLHHYESTLSQLSHVYKNAAVSYPPVVV